MRQQTAELLAFDREHVWHPYTSLKAPDRVRMVTEAQGVHLTLADDEGESKRVIDAMSSWWAAHHGYRHPALDEAVAASLDASAFPHVMFGGLTHEPAIRLGQQLLDLTPASMEHVFFADSGSVSVEVALKMALQYQRGRGRLNRSRMLTIRGGYHGDTRGPMSVCDPEGGMHSMWRSILPEQVFLPTPPKPGPDSALATLPGTDPPRPDTDELSCWIDQARETAKAHQDELAGIIVEPVLQGAGGMNVYDPGCLVALREIADELDLVLIFDEIATAFGRTGAWLAADHAEVVPDVLCLGKALTGGYLSAAATLCNSRIADGIAQSDSGVIMHGPTFMGNPLACRVASASLSLLATNDWRAQVSSIEAALVKGLAPLLDDSVIADVRVLGAVGVVQLDHPVDVPAATDAGLAHGVWLRPFRDLIYTMPPYICTAAEIAIICSAITAATSAA